MMNNNDFLGFILYVIGYVFISLFSDKNKYKLYSTFCGRGKTTDGTDISFFQEQCIFPILSTLIFT